MTFEQHKKNIENKKFAPVYYLYGEESYFIDKLAHLLDENSLEASERDFNRIVLYASETTIGAILNECKSFPIMADRRFVLVKEAQNFAKKDLDKLVNYFQKPSKSTVFVLTFKGKGAKLPAACEKAIEKSGGISFESKKMYEKDVRNWVMMHIMSEGFEMESGVEDLIVSNLGTNLNFIENELDKIFIYLRAIKQKKVNKNIIFEMMNIDKEFNVFELIKALSEKKVARAHFIMDKLSANTKTNPPTLMVGQLFQFFSNIATVFSLKLTDVKNIQVQMKMNYYAAQDYATARKYYPLGVVYRNISYVLEADLMLKGIISSDMDERHILKTLIWKILL